MHTDAHRTFDLASRLAMGVTLKFDGEKFREARRGAKLSQEALAKALRYGNRNSVYEIEAEQQRVPRDRAEEIFRTLRVTDPSAVLDCDDEVNRRYLKRLACEGSRPLELSRDDVAFFEDVSRTEDELERLAHLVAWWGPDEGDDLSNLDRIIAAHRPAQWDRPWANARCHGAAVVLRAILRTKAGVLQGDDRLFHSTLKELAIVMDGDNPVRHAARYMYGKVCFEGTVHAATASRYRLLTDAIREWEALPPVADAAFPLPLSGSRSEYPESELSSTRRLSDPLCRTTRFPTRYAAEFGTQAAFECDSAGQRPERERLLVGSELAIQKCAPGTRAESPHIDLNLCLVEAQLDLAVAAPHSRAAEGEFHSLLGRLKYHEKSLPVEKFHEWSAACHASLARTSGRHRAGHAEEFLRHATAAVSRSPVLASSLLSDSVYRALYQRDPGLKSSVVRAARQASNRSRAVSPAGTSGRPDRVR